MFRRTLLVCSIIFASLFSVGQVPFQGNLSGNAQKNYEEALLLRKSNLTESHRLFRTIYENYSDNDGNEAKWSFLNYCNSLLEVDSLQQASTLFQERQTIKWKDPVEWLKDYQRVTENNIKLRRGEHLEVLTNSNATKDSLDNSFLQLELIKLNAHIFLHKGQFYSSRLKWIEAISVAEEVNDSVQIANCRLQLAQACLADNRLKEALTEINLVKDFFGLGNLPKQVQLLNVESDLSLLNNDVRRAEELSLEAYEMSRITGSLKLQSQSLFQLAKAYSISGNWNQALRQYSTALQMVTQSGELLLVPTLLNEIGSCYFRLGDLKNASEYGHSARVKSGSMGQVQQQIAAMKLLAKISEVDNDYEAAFNFLTFAEQLKDSLITVERLNTSEALELRFKTSRAEQELVLLQQEQTIITNRWITLALGMFLAIIIGILVYDNQKRKHRQQTELLKAEDELRKAEIKIMTEVLEKNQQKLSDYTDNLLKKTELVEKLEYQVKSTVSESGDKAEASKILDNISNVRILTDEDWEEFKLLFDGVHQGLLNRLLKKHHNLTLAEQRLFLLMKLAMSTKQIANILGVSPDSIKKGRYRLKKKLRLTESKTLQEFVDTF